MTQDEFTEMQKKEHEAYLATMAAIDAQRKALVINYKAARERRVKAYEAQIVHNPKRHLKHDCYRLHNHFNRELKSVLTDGRTHGLNLENSSVQFSEETENVVFTITVQKKK